jgi:hypothetical protein
MPFKKSYIILFFFATTGCSSMRNITFYQEAKHPNSLDVFKLKFTTDSEGVLISAQNIEEVFKYKKVKKFCYLIDSSLNYSNQSINLLARDTLVIYKKRIYYYTKTEKIVFKAQK